MNSKYYDRADVVLIVRCIYNNTTKKCDLYLLNKKN